jgi:predicted dehydrogenase
MNGRAIKIGVLGCGFYAHNHLSAWRELAPLGAVLAAVCDIDEAKARNAGRAFDVPWYTDPLRFLEETGLDTVDIVTRQDTHRMLAEEAIHRGIATIVQKPFAPTWEDCVAIVAAAEKAGVWLAVHENFRFQAPMRRIREVIDSGAIGEPNWARIRFRTDFDVYAAQPYFLEDERLVVADVGVHMLDLARYFMGDVLHLTCETQRRGTRPKAEDTATMLVRHLSGAVSIVECTYEAHRAQDPFPETLLEIEGQAGSIVVDAGCRMTLTSDGHVSQHAIDAPLLSWTSHPWHVSQEGAFGACKHFLDCIQRGVPAETSGIDNLKTYALVNAAYQSAAEARIVAPTVYSPDKPR